MPSEIDLRSKPQCPSCPSCDGRLYRVPRRFLDQIVNKFTAVRRYRCFSVACCWEGNLRNPSATCDSQATDRQRQPIL